MKILIFIIGFFLGAYLVSLTTTITYTYKEINLDKAQIFETVEIENCQYLVIKSKNNNTLMFTHKGNCNNPIHGFDQEESSETESFNVNFSPPDKREE